MVKVFSERFATNFDEPFVVFLIGMRANEVLAFSKWLSTAEYESYTTIERPHATVCHGAHEWARDDDGDGKREIHTNTCEGMEAGLHTCLRVFRGVHKFYLSGYIAVHEFRVNLKAVSVSFVAALVALH